MIKKETAKTIRRIIKSVVTSQDEQYSKDFLKMFFYKLAFSKLPNNCDAMIQKIKEIQFIAGHAIQDIFNDIFKETKRNLITDEETDLQIRNMQNLRECFQIGQPYNKIIDDYLEYSKSKSSFEIEFDREMN
jgi:hypothetical protein